MQDGTGAVSEPLHRRDEPFCLIFRFENVNWILNLQRYSRVGSAGLDVTGINVSSGSERESL
jgi:hypothetical protein